MTISNMRKLAAVEKHLAVLGRVHARSARLGQTIVMEEMIVMGAIAADYQALVQQETPRLFAGHERKSNEPHEQ